MGGPSFSPSPPDLTCAFASQVGCHHQTRTPSHPLSLSPSPISVSSSPKSRVSCRLRLQHFQLGELPTSIAVTASFSAYTAYPSSNPHLISQDVSHSFPALACVPRQPCAAFSTPSIPLLAYASTSTDARLANSLSDTILLFLVSSPPSVVTTHDINFPSRPSLTHAPGINPRLPLEPRSHCCCSGTTDYGFINAEIHVRRLLVSRPSSWPAPALPSQSVASSVDDTGLDHHHLASHGSIFITHDQVSLSYHSSQCNPSIETASTEPEYRTTTTKPHGRCRGKSCRALTQP